jgi:hypothetical protein
MATNINGKFFEKDQIPTFDSSLTFSEITKQSGQSGGFIMTEDSIPVKYFSIHELAKSITDNPGSDSIPLLHLSGELNINAGIPVRQVESIPEEIEDSEPKPLVYFTHDNGRPGWLFNNQEAAITVTSPIVYYCINPSTSHSNMSYNNGNCSKCIYPIKSSKQNND